VRAVLDVVPPQLDGITVEVGYSVAPQLILENPTPDPVEILDPEGRPFLTIGPDGVLGNLDSLAWHRSNDPSGANPLPAPLEELLAANPNPPPRWGRVTRDPAWGWFDHRLHPEVPVVPPEMREAGVPADLEPWVVPVRYRGETVELKGRIRFQPVRGGFGYRLVGGDRQVTPAEGVQVAVIGAKDVPGLLLTNTSGREVVVLGRDQEPFLRFSAAGVEANVRSPQWIEYLRAKGQDPGAVAADAAAPPEWVLQTGQQVYPWSELRGSIGAEEPPEDVMRLGVPVDVLEWEVPILVDGERHVVRGVTEWVPKTEPAPTAAEGSAAGLSPAAMRGALALVAVAALAATEVVRRRRAVPTRTEGEY
jgi:hypothetical protein